MNQHLLYMQKLAGLITESEYNKLVAESSLKAKIKELIHASLGEAKKKKDEPEDVAPQEEVPAEDTLEPTDADMGMDMSTDADVDTGIDIDPKVKNIQNLLQKAYANAKSLGDEKLMTQIGNTITMVVRNQVLGGQVAESLEEISGEDNSSDKINYMKMTLQYVWTMGKNNNSINFTDMAGSIIDDLETRLTAESLNEEADKAMVAKYLNLLNDLVQQYAAGDIYDTINLEAAVEIFHNRLKKEIASSGIDEQDA